MWLKSTVKEIYALTIAFIFLSLLLTELEMSGFDNLNTDFYQSSYSVDDQNQGSYGYSNSENPYNK